MSFQLVEKSDDCAMKCDTSYH